jgi:pimeloyl-ACP methyl ester carboxylesterase
MGSWCPESNTLPYYPGRFAGFKILLLLVSSFLRPEPAKHSSDPVTFLIVVLGVGAFLVAVLLAGMACQTIRAQEDARRYPPLGRLVEVAGTRLHIYEAGEGSPTVVFDAALGGSCLSWAHVQAQVARFTRTCSYDRAGMGWSDPGLGPRTAERIVKELRALLHNAGLPPPYVLVGHSFGGFTARLYAAKYRREVAGLVLIDVPDPREWLENPAQKQRAAIGARLSRYGALVARLGIARFVAHLVMAGAVDAARASVHVITAGVLRGHIDRILAPLVRVPPEFRPILRHFWTHPKFYAALAGQMESISETAAQVLASANGYGDLPLVVLSASNPAPAHFAAQEGVARLSSRGRHLVATRSGHWIQLDQPDLVIEAVRQVVEQARASAERAASALFLN